MKGVLSKIPTRLLREPKEGLLVSELAMLLKLSESITETADLKDLFARFYRLLQPIFRFEMSAVFLLSEDGQFVESLSPTFLLPSHVSPPDVPNCRMPISFLDPYPPLDSPAFYRVATKRGLEHPGVPEEFRQFLSDARIEEDVLCPLFHCGKVIGQLQLSNGPKGLILDEQLPLLRRVCQLIAGTVANAIALERLERKEHIAKCTVQLANRLMGRRDLGSFACDLAEGLSALYPLRFLSVQGLPGGASDVCLAPFQGGWRDCGGATVPWTGDVEVKEGIALRNYEPGELETAHGDRPEILALLASRGITGSAHVRLFPAESFPVTLFLGVDAGVSEQSTNPEALEKVMPQVLLALQGLIQWERNRDFQGRLQLENQAFKDELSKPSKPGLISGESSAFLACLSLARQAAPLDTTVLLLGETGTGKEMLASYVHGHSSRSDKPFVRINCASLPSALIESELFGHEKGAFTGALERHIGKFELAHGGTIFLDEVGELPLESQSKLLRVLQERELERLGGLGVISVDVRVIAATNRDLEEEVRAGRFRSDLYYRLNVFPLLLPPLRERQEDIPVLAETFLRGFARSFGRSVRMLNGAEVDVLKAYRWPGNIRELKHVMERAVITASGGEPNILVPRDAYAAGRGPERPMVLRPLDETIREQILAALRRTGGRISGPDGAAALLHLNAKTLESKMRKYGMRRQVAFAGG
jgi:transcriptional regulator with GAF, ATPase, and Fis domain